MFSISNHYGNKTRIRVCGLLWKHDKLLLIKHEGLGPMGYFWSPPGGGLEFGETLQEALIREMKEETTLDVSVGNFAFITQYINLPLHAIEFFFNCEWLAGDVSLGLDPEQTEQSLTDLQWMTYQEILEIPREARHHSFSLASTKEEFQMLNGMI